MKPERNSFLVKGFVHEEMTSYRKQMVFYVEDWYLIAPIKRYYGQEDYRQEQRFFYHKKISAIQVIISSIQNIRSQKILRRITFDIYFLFYMTILKITHPATVVFCGFHIIYLWNQSATVFWLKDMFMMN